MARRREAPIVPTSGWAAWLTGLAAAAMAFLAVLALTGGLAAERLADEWRGALDGAATVRIPGEAETLARRTERVMEVLEQTPGIARARPLGREDQLALLTPWLGEAGALEHLPVPQLIDVTLKPPGPDTEALRSRLEEAAQGAVYDDHEAWRRQLSGAAAGLSRLAWAAAGAIVLTAAVMVGLAARASVAANSAVVRVLRIIGAEDAFISAAFTRRIAVRAALGALGGTALALAAIRTLPEIGVDRALGPVLGPGPAGWLLLLVAVPAGAALVAWAVARQAVGRELSGMP